MSKLEIRNFNSSAKEVVKQLQEQLRTKLREEESNLGLLNHMQNDEWNELLNSIRRTSLFQKMDKENTALIEDLI